MNERDQETISDNLQKEIEKTLERNKPKEFGRYLVKRKIAEGGMGRIYEVYDPKEKKSFALKTILDTRKKLIERFLKEARAMQRLSHPNIIKVYDLGASPQAYFTMDLVEGLSLYSLLKQKKLPLSYGVYISYVIALALQHTHEKGVLHRDIKPENVMVDCKGHIFLMDYGLAKLEDSNTRLTNTTAILGTPAYMSPEQAQGHNNQVDYQSDIYSLGTVLYRLITGEVPFDGDTTVGIIMNIIKQKAPPPRQINPKIPVDLENICLKAIAKNKEKRYFKVADLIDHLEKVFQKMFGQTISSQKNRIESRLGMLICEVIEKKKAAQKTAKPPTISSQEKTENFENTEEHANEDAQTVMDSQIADPSTLTQIDPVALTPSFSLFKEEKEEKEEKNTPQKAPQESSSQVSLVPPLSSSQVSLKLFPEKENEFAQEPTEKIWGGVRKVGQAIQRGIEERKEKISPKEEDFDESHILRLAEPLYIHDQTETKAETKVKAQLEKKETNKAIWLLKKLFLLIFWIIRKLVSLIFKKTTPSSEKEKELDFAEDSPPPPRPLYLPPIIANQKKVERKEASNWPRNLFFILLLFFALLLFEQDIVTPIESILGRDIPPIPWPWR